MKSWRPSFALLLPLVNVCLWAILLAVPTTVIYLRLEQMSQGAENATIQSHGYDVATVPRGSFFLFALRASCNWVESSVVAANMPGFAIDFLISLPTTWPDAWHPKKLSPDIWRPISLPIYCLPAWWLVGLGLDGLIRRRRLRWFTILIGTILCVLFIVLFVGFRFGLPADNRLEMGLLLGSAAWAAMFAVFPVGFVIRWQDQRNTRRRAA